MDNRLTAARTPVPVFGLGLLRSNPEGLDRMKFYTGIIQRLRVARSQFGSR
jgi:hypothetical protein